MNIFKLSVNVLNSRATCIEWCQSNKLLPSTKICPLKSCGKPMSLDIKSSKCIGIFRCRNKIKGRSHDKQISLAVGTWFENSKLSIEKALMLTYCFSSKFTYQQTEAETSLGIETTSSRTICDWFSYCRELCILSLEDIYQSESLIGGEGHVVEIDESKFGKRKYNVGRLKEGSWVLGFVDLGCVGELVPKKYRLEIIPNNSRDEETLLELIKKHVKPGSTVMTDKWKGYMNLDRNGYNHLTVNHTYNFIVVARESILSTLKRSLDFLLIGIPRSLLTMFPSILFSCSFSVSFNTHDSIP